MIHDTNEFYDTVAAQYHLFYRDWWTAVERDGAYLHRLFSGHDIHTVLDTSCGPGTQAIGLAQRGYQVTGVDPSGALLALAVSNAEETGVTEQATFLPGSFLELPDVVTGPFDAVISKGDPASSDASSAGDGVLNIFISDNLDFTSTDDQMELLNSWGQPVDGVIWNNGDTIASGNAGDFDSMAEFMWKYPLLNDNYASNEYNARTVKVAGKTLAAGEALARWRDTNGNYFDSNKKTDWYVTNIFTKGNDNFIKTYSEFPAEILLTETYLNDNEPDERFIEIYNADCRTIDISDYSLTNSQGIGPNFSTTNAWLLPNQFGVIFFTNKTTEVCAAQKNTLIIFYPIQPDDTSDIIALRDNSGRIINSFSYNSSPETGISWNRELDSLTAEFKNNDTSDDWDYGLPTPGAFPEAVPEPTSCLMFLIGYLTTIIWQKRY